MYKKYPSLLIILIIYLLTVFLGIIVYKVLPFGNSLFNLFVANVTATIFIWLVGLWLKNASLYDPYWSVIPPVIVVLYVIDKNYTWTTVSLLAMIGLSIWSFRLTLNWAKGWVGFQEQDWRYTMIKEKAPKLYLLSNLFGIHLMPTTIVFIQLLTIEKLFSHAVLSYVLLFAGFLIMVVSAYIQYVADEQMRKFKERNKKDKQCIDEGLWKYSRHPNYFGEIMVWWGLYMIYFSTTLRIDLYLLAPIMMTLLFVFISIPMMEKKILKTRPAYKDYQERVSMLLPFFRKEDESNKVGEET